ncbi:MAG: ATP synthase F1 subunit gamma [Oscillospiraceae bacterium]|nr:ATP synthase F1 subunit gamma [Oscillospiraceae bacterium]
MASGNMKTIKRRIKSVSSTMQITKAMELVASSKLRKAKKKTKDTKPFFTEQELILNGIYASFSEKTKENSFDTKFEKHRDVKNRLYIVIAGDKGLAGGYNSNVFKLVNHVHSNCNTADVKPKIIAIGKKSVEYFERRGHDILVKRVNFADNIKSGHCSEVADTAIKMFTSGEVDEVTMFYTRFVSSMVQETSTMRLLPLETPHQKLKRLQEESETDVTKKAEAKRLKKSLEEFQKSPITATYDPSPEAVLSRIIPNFLAGLVQSAITESYTSELSARQRAMESASDNAGDMIDNLSLLYNRARQEKITNEINEIVGGANAL